jgi:hypothetical protein
MDAKDGVGMAISFDSRTQAHVETLLENEFKVCMADVQIMVQLELMKNNTSSNSQAIPATELGEMY